jgi:hypothetical protein
MITESTFGGGAAIRQRELEFIGVIRSFDYEERTTADLLTFSVSDRGFQVQGDVFKALPYLVAGADWFLGTVANTAGSVFERFGKWW